MTEPTHVITCKDKIVSRIFVSIMVSAILLGAFFLTYSNIRGTNEHAYVLAHGLHTVGTPVGRHRYTSTHLSAYEYSYMAYGREYRIVSRKTVLSLPPYENAPTKTIYYMPSDPNRAVIKE